MTVQPSARPNVKRKPRMTGASMAILALRVSQVEQDVDDMQEKISTISTAFDSIKNRLNLWGGVLLGAFAASGFIDGKAVAVIKAIFNVP